MLQLLNLPTVVFKQYQKIYFILQFSFTVFQVQQVKTNAQNLI